MLNADVRAMLHNPARLVALDRARIMGTPIEERFDRLLRLALRALSAPTGMVNFVDADRQHFKSAISTSGTGQPARTFPLEWGFCPHTMATRAPMCIPDARQDPVLVTNPVVRNLGIVAYLGTPLIDAEGQVLGTVCVLDTRHRQWRSTDVEVVTTVASAVMSEIELGIAGSRQEQLEALEQRAADRERWRAAQLHTLAETSLLIYSAPSVDDALRVITDQARGLIGAHQSATVVAPDGDWSRSTCVYSTDPGSPPSGTGSGLPRNRWWLYSLVRRRNRPIRSTPAELRTHPDRPLDQPAGANEPPFHCWLAVPLIARDGMNLGVLEVSDRYTGDFTEEDELILLQLAQLASVAIENTRLSEEQADLADAFQASLLPPTLPDIPGLRVGTQYRPARRARVAGDFYDLFPLPGATWGIAIGDVRGKGPRPATVAAAARHLVRAAAVGLDSPAEVLARLNESLIIARNGDDEQFCTLAYAALRAGDGECELDVASGGHPLPRLLRHDGSVTAITAMGSLLGAFEDVDFTERTVALSPGDAVVFFTDGLTEAVVDGRQLESEGLTPHLAALAGRDAQDIADALADLLAQPGAKQRDDLAILVLSRDT